MKLHKKSLFLILSIYIPLLIIFFLGIYTGMIHYYHNLEIDMIQKDLSRFSNALKIDMRQIASLAYDYAAWDDTYAFVEDENSEYIESNFVPTTFTGSDLSIIAIQKLDGTFVYAEQLNMNTTLLEPISPATLSDLKLTVTAQQLSATKRTAGGMISTEQGPLMLCMHAITTSDDTGPIRGYMIMGRYIIPEYIQSIGMQTELTATYIPIKNPPDADAQQISQLLTSGTPSPFNPILIYPLNNHIINGYILLRDFNQNPAFAVKISIPRTLYQTGLKSIMYLLMMSLIILLTSGFILLGLIEKILISRMVNLSASLSRIAEMPEQALPLCPTGDDELTSIELNINHLLKVLAERRSELEENEGKYRSFVENFQGLAFRLTLKFENIFTHGALNAISGYDHSDLTDHGLVWYDLVLPEDLPTFKRVSKKIRTDSGFRCEREYRIRHKSGKIRWVHEYIQNVCDENGKPIYIQGVLFDITARKTAEENLQNTKHQLDRLTRHLQDARETEQSRIAQRLQDELGQLIITLKADIRWGAKQIAESDPALQSYTDDALKHLSEIEDCISNIATELKPGVLDSLGLQDALEWLIHRFAKEHIIKCICKIDLQDFEPDRYFSTAVFRIVQEGLVNVFRHAAASQVFLSIVVSGDQLKLELIDDGIGIPPQALQSRDSFGLTQMHERAECINGTLTIQPLAAGGTGLYLNVPVQQ